MLNVASSMVAFVWLRLFSTALPSSSRLLLRITVAGSLLSVAMVPLSWIPPDRLPSALLVLMPGRYLNFGALTFVAMLIGLLGSCRAIWSRLVLLFLSCGLLVTSRSMLVGVSRASSQHSVSDSTSGRSGSSGCPLSCYSPAPYGRAEGRGQRARRRTRRACTHCTCRNCSCSLSSC